MVYNVGIIAEGPTDVTIIEGILKSCFADDTFLFRTISPTPEEIQSQRKEEGFGWGGVYRVCQGLAKKLDMLSMMSAPFDFLVVHVDGDVAYKDYTSIGETPLKVDLPCASEKETIQEAGLTFEQVVKQWIHDAVPQVVFCLPFMCTETWVGQWLYPDHWTDIDEKTSDEIIYQRLLLLAKPKSEKERRIIRQHGDKMKKITKNYRKAAEQMTKTDWKTVTEKYIQAKRFDTSLKKRLSR